MFSNWPPEGVVLVMLVNCIIPLYVWFSVHARVALPE